MGSRTDARIEAWQDQSGIKPATGKYAELLMRLSDAAFDAIKIIELERSGIRDGDGYWHGSDVFGYTMGELIHLCKQLKKLASKILSLEDAEALAKEARQ